MKTKLLFLLFALFLISGNVYADDRSVTVKPKKGNKNLNKRRIRK